MIDGEFKGMVQYTHSHIYVDLYRGGRHFNYPSLRKKKKHSQIVNNHDDVINNHDDIIKNHDDVIMIVDFLGMLPFLTKRRLIKVMLQLP